MSDESAKGEASPATRLRRMHKRTLAVCVLVLVGCSASKSSSGSDAGCVLPATDCSGGQGTGDSGPALDAGTETDGGADAGAAADAGVLTVAAVSATYASENYPFMARIVDGGGVLVSGATGLQVFGPIPDGGLQSECVNGLGLSNSPLEDFSILPQGIDVAAAAGNAGVVFANLASLQGCDATGYVVSQGQAPGTLAVAVTLDQAYAFAANEYAVAPGARTQGSVSVIKLQLDENGDVTAGTQVIGQISTGGDAIAGILLSPDGTRLYVTTEVAAADTSAWGGSNPVLARTGCVQQAGGPSTINGLLTVIDVVQAEANPGQGAILETFDAACSPVRLAENAVQSVLWVTARGDNRVLAFSPSLLEAGSDAALIGYGSTGGTDPVGVALFHNDQLLAVANSDRFGSGSANLTVMDVADPTHMSVLQTVTTGQFPREITVGADDATLYLTNYDSSSVQVIQTIVN